MGWVKKGVEVFIDPPWTDEIGHFAACNSFFWSMGIAWQPEECDLDATALKLCVLAASMSSLFL